MNSATVQAALNLVIAVTPLIEQGAIALITDVNTMLADARSSTDATPDQLAQAEALAEQSDAAQAKAFAAYEAMVAAKGAA